VTGDREERNRVLGFPVGGNTYRRPATYRQPDEEPGPPFRADERGPSWRADEPGPRRADEPGPRRADGPRPPRRADEQQRVLGFPVDWFGQFGRDPLGPLVHAIQESRRWLQRRGLGRS
jgi:hypothetical protein